MGKGRGAATIRSLPNMGCRACGQSCTRPCPADAAGVGIEWACSPAHQLLCDANTRPASCHNLTFKHFLRALSALHFGISADGAQRMLSHMPVYNEMFRNERKKRLRLHHDHMFLKTLKACSQSEDGGREQARARLLQEWDKEKWHSAKRLMKGAAAR